MILYTVSLGGEVGCSLVILRPVYWTQSLKAKAVGSFERCGISNPTPCT
jgi:hypothetical protein